MDKLKSTKERLRRKCQQAKGPAKICLTMIVRNESANMPRLLPTVKPFIDMISIVDTGSTDNTIEIIKQWGRENNLPTAVHQEPWKNFSYNRTHSVQKAKETYGNNVDYFLLSDADFVWSPGSVPLDKKSLINEQYTIRQQSSALSYYNTRLLSAKVDWECCCLTHEFWAPKGKQSLYQGEVTANKLEAMWIDDREDGGFKADKFERDERLLREQITTKYPKPWRIRGLFYLANTLKDTKKYLEAIEYYKKRIEYGGYQEEVFYSHFQIGFCYENLAWELRWDIVNNKKQTMPHIKALEKIKYYFEQATESYLYAHKYRKTRNESLCYLARMYRNLSRTKEAIETAMKAKTIKYPDDQLFVVYHCYDITPDYEIFMASINKPEYKEYGRMARNVLKTRDNLPDYVKTDLEKWGSSFN